MSTLRAAFSERATVVARLSAGPVEYRLEGRSPRTVVVLHGGHLRAGLALGEEVFADADLTVLAPSRPGYGRTPLTTGTTPAGFADATSQLCRTLGIERLAAVVGISAGGRTALTMAARHDRSVPFAHAESLAAAMPNAELVDGRADSHLIWFGPDYPAFRES